MIILGPRRCAAARPSTNDWTTLAESNRRTTVVAAGIGPTGVQASTGSEAVE